jgi:NAD-dependent dihydropyrimidine dehydrogenase PreA subunit
MTVDIPKERIAWFPTIDYGICTADRACLDFCHNDVFHWNEAEARVEVVNRDNCVLGCTSCAQICPVEAISFPDKEELRQTLRRLRAEVSRGQALSDPPPA